MNSISPFLGYFSVTFKNLKQGIFSAAAWSVVWALSFIASNTAIILTRTDSNMNISEISAIGLTFAVIAGNSPKIISYLVGCDTDFRHLFIKHNDRDYEEPKPIRLIISLAALVLSVILLVSNIGHANELVDVTKFDVFALYSSGFYSVIGLLFIAQITFSWPEPNIGKIY